MFYILAAILAVVALGYALAAVGASENRDLAADPVTAHYWQGVCRRSGSTAFGFFVAAVVCVGLAS